MSTERARNIFSLLLEPANRPLLAGLLFMLVIALSVVTYIVVKHRAADEPQGMASVKSNSVSVGEASVATGKESKEYLKKVDEYNTVVLAERRKDNPSAHPIPVMGDLNAQSCQSNNDAWVNCLRTTGVLSAEECATTDTQCMINNGLIDEGKCAPADILCQKAKGMVAGGYCDPTNYACIAERARVAGCQVDDTQCLREKGIIAADACAPGDDNCDSARFSFCAVNDLACIQRRAEEVGCTLSDTACLREQGIIAATACAPNDIDCKRTPASSFCLPDDIACIIEKARLSGCEVDDTVCLIAAGIIAPGACAPGDTGCVGEKYGFCDENDVACIERLAKDAGCGVSDTQCLRESGIIAVTACAPGDQLCRRQRSYCDPLDADCIAQRAKLAGCNPTDSECLRAAGVIAPEACVLGDTQCDYLGDSSSNTPGGCSSGDISCIARALIATDCTLAETQCLRREGIIGSQDCAPKDTACNNRLTDKGNGSAGGLVGGSNRDNDYARAASGKSRGQYGGGYSGAGEKISDTGYMDQLIKFVEKRSVSRKPVEISLKNKATGLPDASRDVADKNSAVASDNKREDSNTSDDKGERLVTAGQVMYAITDIALSSDYEGPVALTLLRPGPLHRAKLLGKMVTVEEKMRLELNKMIKSNGEEFSIEAVALDPATTYAAVVSQVNHHYVYRYGWWGAGTVLSAIGKAAAMRAQEVVIVPNGGTAQGSDMDTSGEIKVAVGELGESIGEQAQKNIDRPITVEVNVNEELGVFFLKTVYEGDAI